jgi:hypothetical protein
MYVYGCDGKRVSKFALQTIQKIDEGVGISKTEGPSEE